MKMRKGDVIQIAPSANVQEALRGQFAIVTEVTGWGCKAGVTSFGAEGVAHVRCATGDFAHVGTAPWVPSWVYE